MKTEICIDLNDISLLAHARVMMSHKSSGPRGDPGCVDEERYYVSPYVS